MFSMQDNHCFYKVLGVTGEKLAKTLGILIMIAKNLQNPQVFLSISKKITKS